MTESTPGDASLARAFDAYAAGEALAPEYAEGDTRDRVLEHLDPVSDDLALDLGAGAGAMSVALAPYVRRVVALDLSRAMLRAAWFAARRRGRMAPLAVRGEAEQLPLRDGCIDVLACRHTARYFGDPARAVLEMARVLRLGGRVVVLDAVASGDPEVDAVLDALESLHSPTPVRLRTAAAWRELLLDTGLRVDWMDEPLFDRAEGRSLMDWSARAGLSQSGFEQARALLRGASEKVRRHLRVLVHGDDLQLNVPLAIVAGKRVT
ncbi:MAG: class I SAM-dependent methyltransferase [Candidatus Eisenbacteria bacterium]